MLSDNPNLESIKIKIIDLLKDDFPIVVSMAYKNWGRYKACIEFYTSNVGKDNRKSLKILDYGCGHPIISKILKDLGYKNITAYEPYADEVHWQVAERLGVKDIYTTCLKEGETFDHVLLIDVIEHLWPIKPVMHDVNNRTRLNGWLIVSTPNVHRISLWMKFVLRRTGHPTPLIKFLKAEDNYTDHQREFTMKELKSTLSYFGFNSQFFTTKNTKGRREDITRYQRAKGVNNNVKKHSFTMRPLGFFNNLMMSLFPSIFGNNLLVGAKKSKHM